MYQMYLIIYTERKNCQLTYHLEGRKEVSTTEKEGRTAVTTATYLLTHNRP